MKNMFFKRFLKPKWEHKNPQVRKQALQALDESLPSTQVLYARAAVEDADPVIRQVVVRQLLDIDVLQNVANRDQDGSVRQTASRRVERMLTGQDGLNLDLAARLAWVQTSDDRCLLEQIARCGKESVLRLEAMGRVGKEGLYGDLALTDRDASVRLRAVGLINQKSTLERVYKQARNKDKRVRMLVQSRLQDMESEAQLPQRLIQKAKQFCLEAEQLAHKYTDAAGFEKQASSWMDLAQRWQNLLKECEIENEYIQRFKRVADKLNAWLAEIDKMRQVQTREVKEKEQIANKLNELIEPLFLLESKMNSEFTPSANLVDEIKETLLDVQRHWHQFTQTVVIAEALPQRDTYRAVCARLQHQINKTEHDHRLREIEHTEEMVKTIIGEFKQGVLLLEDLLHKGASRQAEKIGKRLAQQLKQLPATEEHKLKKFGIYKRYQRALNQVQELRDWQGWATLPAQEQLCETIEKLAAEILAHENEPDFDFDKVAKQIKLLRKEWQNLGEAQEKEAAQLLWVRFNDACNQAYAPCQLYFDQQTQQRDENCSNKNALSETLESCLENIKKKEDIDWKSIDKQVREGQQKWNAIGPVNRKDKTAVGHRFRKVMAALRDELREERERNHKRKSSLITEAAKLYEALETSNKDQKEIQQAVAAMKTVQLKWKNTGMARGDKALWEQFRAIGDRIFGERQVRYEDQIKERTMRFNHKKTLTIMLENIATLEEEELKQAQPQIKKIKQEWQEVGPVDRTKQQEVDHSFKQACERCEHALAILFQQEQQQEKLRIQEKVALCEHLENLVEKCSKNHNIRAHMLPELTNIQHAWQKLAVLVDTKLNVALNQRYKIAYEEGGKFCNSGSAQSKFSVQLDAARLKNLERKEALCIQMEILAGVSSPETAKEQRMAYQVAQLANKMAIKAISGTKGYKLPQIEEAERLYFEWLTIGAIPANRRGELNERFTAAHQMFLQQQLSE
ncbi:MAG: DUF349 domain-containing protein [Gammaproteobacteria bacterium]|nr:DUF349 domain-containing protein [Gammaproteobacteria bacterium]